MWWVEKSIITKSNVSCRISFRIPCVSFPPSTHFLHRWLKHIIFEKIVLWTKYAVSRYTRQCKKTRARKSCFCKEHTFWSSQRIRCIYMCLNEWNRYKLSSLVPFYWSHKTRSYRWKFIKNFFFTPPYVLFFEIVRTSLLRLWFCGFALSRKFHIILNYCYDKTYCFV